MYLSLTMERLDVFSSKNYKVKGLDAFKQLWNDRELADVTLATCDDNQIKLHKVILSSFSRFFKNILLKNPHPNPLLDLKDIRMKDLEPVLKFIYFGQCQVYQADFEGFIETARLLDVASLDDTSIEHSKDGTDYIEPKNVIAEGADTKEDIMIKQEMDLDYNYKENKDIAALYGDYV